jgi:hypothetical protein
MKLKFMRDFSWKILALMLMLSVSSYSQVTNTFQKVKIKVVPENGANEKVLSVDNDGNVQFINRGSIEGTPSGLQEVVDVSEDANKITLTDTIFNSQSFIGASTTFGYIVENERSKDPLGGTLVGGCTHKEV